MNERLSSTSVIGEVVRQTECFFTEDIDEFFLFLDTLLVKDSAKLVECVCSISAEGRDVLRLILADVDGSCSNDRFCRTASISLDRYGEARCKTDGVVNFVCSSSVMFL